MYTTERREAWRPSLESPDRLTRDWSERRQFGAEKKGMQKNQRGTFTALHTQLGTITYTVNNGLCSSCQRYSPYPASGLGW
jgi:hypothetical protein